MAELLEKRNRIDALLEEGATDEAERVLNEILSLPTTWPERGNILFMAGRVALAQGNPKKAIAVLEECTRLARESRDTAPRAYFFLGLAYRSAGLTGAARLAYHEAADDARIDGAKRVLMCALHNLAALYCPSKRPNEAREALDEAVPLLESDDDRMHQQIGEWNLTLINGNASERITAQAGAGHVEANTSLSAFIRAQAAIVNRRLLQSLGDVAAARAGFDEVEALAASTGVTWLVGDVLALKAGLTQQRAGAH